MRIIISPAKKMRTDPDSLPWRDLPRFLPQAETLAGALRAMTREELKALWKCNDAITDQNLRRLETMDLRHGLTPAILAYEGIQYQYMAPGVFGEAEYDYLQAHLRILSGLYGVLRPFDGVTPYRLEMQAKLKICKANNLYGYWGRSLAQEICRDTDCVVNLASKEYSLAVSRHLPPDQRWITCVFGQERGGKIVEKGTLCKMARGEMVRYLAECQAETPEVLRTFDRLEFTYAPAWSDEGTYVFLQRSPGRRGL